jgi:uncharacterized repeat protein (TIGR01451 family)
VVNNGDGSYNVTYSIVVSNAGDVVLNNVQVIDALTDTFLAPVAFAVSSITADAPLVANSAFNGTADPAMLAGTQSLPVGAQSLITLTVVVTPGVALAGPHVNQASGVATSPGTQTVTDNSVNGANIDPNGNGNP